MKAHWKQIVIVLSLVVAAPAIVMAIEVGQPAPSFSLPQVSGGAPVELSALKGKVVVIDFWASWCGACVKAFPELDRIQTSYASKGVQVITISTDSEVSSARAKLGATPHAFKALIDADSSVAERYGADEELPTTVIVDKQGRVRYFHRGEGIRWADVTKTLDSLL